MRRTSSREVYRNAWMSVREDTVVLPDGTPGTYGVVDKPDFALVVPVADGGFWLVEQYRYPVGRRAGSSHRAPGGPAPAARPPIWCAPVRWWTARASRRTACWSSTGWRRSADPTNNSS